MRDWRKIQGVLKSAACVAAMWAMSCPLAEEPKPPRPPIADGPIKKDDEKPDSKNPGDKKPKNVPDSTPPAGETVPLDPTQLTPAMRDALNPPAPAVPREAQRPAAPAAEATSCSRTVPRAKSAAAAIAVAVPAP